MKRSAKAAVAMAGGALAVLLIAAVATGTTPQGIVSKLAGGGTTPGYVTPHTSNYTYPNWCCSWTTTCRVPPGMQPLPAYCCGCGCYFTQQNGVPCQPVKCLEACPVYGAAQPA